MKKKAQKGKKRIAIGTILVIGQFASFIGTYVGAGYAGAYDPSAYMNWGSFFLLTFVGLGLILWGAYANGQKH